MSKKRKNASLPFSLKITLVSITIIAICFTYVMVSLYINSGELGEQVGSIMGGLEGSIVGGISGFQHGSEDGKTDGLNADDVSVSIENDIVLSGDFQVQTTNFEYVDSNLIGTETALLTRYKAVIIYSVDLSNAIVTSNDKNVTVTLEKVVGTINVGEIEKLDFWSRSDKAGSTQDAYEAAGSSDIHVREAIKSELNKSEKYNMGAKQAAIDQVSELVENMLLEKKNVEVIIKKAGVDYVS